MATGTFICVLIAFIIFGLWSLACVTFGASLMYRKQVRRAPASLPALDEGKWRAAILGGLGLKGGGGNQPEDDDTSGVRGDPKSDETRYNPSRVPGGTPPTGIGPGQTSDNTEDTDA